MRKIVISFLVAVLVLTGVFVDACGQQEKLYFDLTQPLDTSDLIQSKVISNWARTIAACKVVKISDHTLTLAPFNKKEFGNKIIEVVVGENLWSVVAVLPGHVTEDKNFEDIKIGDLVVITQYSWGAQISILSELSQSKLKGALVGEPVPGKPALAYWTAQIKGEVKKISSHDLTLVKNGDTLENVSVREDTTIWLKTSPDSTKKVDFEEIKLGDEVYASVYFFNVREYQELEVRTITISLRQ